MPTPRLVEPPDQKRLSDSIRVASKTLRTDVVRIPSHTERDIGVDTASSKDGTNVLDGGDGRRDEHDEADESSAAEADHEDTTLAATVSKDTTCNGADAGADIGRDGHKLALFVGEDTHVLDDGGQEQGEGVETDVDTLKGYK